MGLHPPGMAHPGRAAAPWARAPRGAPRGHHAWQLGFGGTDCALPMLWALEHKVEGDVFVIYTDSETWAGKVHAAEALRRCRDKTGIPAKLAVVGMTSSGFSIADPNGAGMLDVVGFDTATSDLIAGFASGFGPE